MDKRPSRASRTFRSSSLSSLDKRIKKNEERAKRSEERIAKLNSNRRSTGPYIPTLELPQLSKADVDRYRCSMAHNVQRDLLQKGYHKSFSYLHALLRKQEVEAAAAIAAETKEEWTRNLVRDSMDKLSKISKKFMEAEDAYKSEIRCRLTGEKTNICHNLSASQEALLPLSEQFINPESNINWSNSADADVTRPTPLKQDKIRRCSEGQTIGSNGQSLKPRGSDVTRALKAIQLGSKVKRNSSVASSRNLSNMPLSSTSVGDDAGSSHPPVPPPSTSVRGSSQSLSNVVVKPVVRGSSRSLSNVVVKPVVKGSSQSLSNVVVKPAKPLEEESLVISAKVMEQKPRADRMRKSYKTDDNSPIRGFSETNGALSVSSIALPPVPPPSDAYSELDLESRTSDLVEVRSSFAKPACPVGGAPTQEAISIVEKSTSGPNSFRQSTKPTVIKLAVPESKDKTAEEEEEEEEEDREVPSAAAMKTFFDFDYRISSEVEIRRYGDTTMGTDWGSRLKTYSTTSVKVRTIFLSLGKFFEKNDADIWLANHFFKMACDVSDRLEGNVMAALSRRHLGRVLVKRGKVSEAAQILRSYFALSRDQPWVNEDGLRCEVDARMMLARCFFLLLDDAEEIEERLQFANDAYVAASRCKDRSLEEESKIRLCEANYQAGLYEEAMQLATDFHAYISSSTPKKQIVKFLEVSARVSRRQGNLGAALNYGLEYSKTMENQGPYARK